MTRKQMAWRLLAFSSGLAVIAVTFYGLVVLPDVAPPIEGLFLAAGIASLLALSVRLLIYAFSVPEIVRLPLFHHSV